MPRLRVPRMPRQPTTREAALTAAVLVVANVPLIRTWMLHFGATEHELDATLAGDDLLDEANLVSTRAVSINASAAVVWSWLVQIGQGRGGFYSYDRLENAFGCEVRSADRIEAQWQQLEVGDRIGLHPKVQLTVAEVTPERSLVLRSPAGGDDTPPYDFTWAFELRRGRGSTTRLVVRERYAYRSGWSALVAEPVAAVSFVMSEKMLRGLRSRAEATARHEPRPTSA